MPFDLQFTTYETCALGPGLAPHALVETARGAVRAVDLTAGDLVMTVDNGPVAVRSVVLSRRPAWGPCAPVLVDAAVFGGKGLVEMAPDTRILVSTHFAELLFGDHEVLVTAHDLARRCGKVSPREGQMVDFIQIVFDRRELVVVDGVTVEAATCDQIGQRGAEVVETADSCRIVLTGAEAAVLIDDVA